MGLVILLAVLSGCPNGMLAGWFDDTPPGEVTDLAAEIGDGIAIITWNPPGDDDFAGVEISYASGDNTDITFDGTADAAGTEITGLLNGTEYTVVVKTIDAVGNESDGVSASVRPLAGGAVASGEAFDYLGFSGADVTADGVYRTEVGFAPDEGVYDAFMTGPSVTDGNFFIFDVEDSSPSEAVDEGTYSVVPGLSNTTETAGNVSLFRIAKSYTGYYGSDQAASYVAGSFEESGWGDSSTIDFTSYDEIDGGTVTVTKNGDTYTFAWNLTVKGTEERIVGSYAGAVDAIR
jgi:hypothetical protein